MLEKHPERDLEGTRGRCASTRRQLILVDWFIALRTYGIFVEPNLPASATAHVSAWRRPRLRGYGRADGAERDGAQLLQTDGGVALRALLLGVLVEPRRCGAGSAQK